MKIKVIEHNEAFRELKEDWDRLANHATVKFDWLYMWWKYFGKGNELKILVAEDSSEIIAIVPLYIQNARALKFFSIRKLCFLGGELSDYLGFLVKDGYDKEQVFNNFLIYMLNDLSYDTLELCQINTMYSDFALWYEYAHLNGFKVNRAKTNTGLKLFEFSSYQDYYENFLSKSIKKTFRHKLNRIKRNNNKIEFIFKKLVTREDIDIISDLNIKRQKFLYEKGDKKRDSYFSDPIRKEFLTEYLTQGNSQLLAYLKLNDEIIAFELAFACDEMLYLWMSGFNQEYEKHSPSKLLLNEFIKYAFENNFQYLDFLRGEEPYKFDWVNCKSVNYNIVKDISFKAKFVSFCRKSSPEFLLNILRPSEIKMLQQGK